MTSTLPTLLLGATVEAQLEAARRRIEVSDEELAEARTRRGALADTLRMEFGGRTYVNGSLAHGDALTPLTDIDLGVVVPNTDGRYGPGARGPLELQQRAAEAIRAQLKEQYGDLRVEVAGRKRSVLVRFRDPVTAGQPDFTADVIVALDHPSGIGLWIPEWSSWSRSHPERHTELVTAANKQTRSQFARVVRLLKHWSRQHDKPLCSWHIKALTLECLSGQSTLVHGLQQWLRHAHASLQVGDTWDPARVAGPIRLDERLSRKDVLAELAGAGELLAEALLYENAGYPLLAQDRLAKLFRDQEMLPAPDQDAVRQQQLRYTTGQQKRDTARLGTPALLTGTHPTRERVNVRSWAP